MKQQNLVPLWKQHKQHQLKQPHQQGKLSSISRTLFHYLDPTRNSLRNRTHSPNIFINLPLPPHAEPKPKHSPDKDWLHTSNQVQTAKYSLITFLPRNLAEQFQRVANVFFLTLVILQFIPKFSQVSPALAALPLLSVVAITAIKDAYEDLRRHRADHKTNHQIALKLSSSIYTNPNLSQPSTSRLRFKWLSSSSSSSHSALKARNKSRSHWWSRRRRVVPAQTDSLKSDRPSSPPLIPPTHSDPDRTDPSHVKDDSNQDDPSRGFEPACWQDLKVGDFVILRNNDPVPADMIICSTSDSEENVCFIETRNLDGETNLKSRHALPALQHLRSAQICSNQQNDPRNRFIIENNLPNANMFSYSAAIVFPDVPSKLDNQPQDPSSKPNQSVHRVPVDLNSVLLRGTVVRNTEWVIGVISFTGLDTKIMMNSSGTPSKRSKVERQMNPMVFINLVILALMCIFNAIGTRISDQYYFDRRSYWTIGQDQPGDNPSLNGLLGFVYAMITYQNIVPISLYISIEFVRTLQAYLIWADDDMEDGERRTLARSWNLSDDLGQIQYIFSDKTGTLTQNLMQFRQCSIGGKVYRGKDQLGSIGEEDEEGTTVNGDITALKSLKSGLNEEAKGEDHQLLSQEKNRENIKLPSQPFKDSELMSDLAQVDTDQSRTLHGFFACLALCHTVLVSEDEQGSIEYKAQSPDEQALVQAAASVGFVFRGREKNIVRLQVPFSDAPYGDERNSRISATTTMDIEEVGPSVIPRTPQVNEYELLEVLEFTSSRKRMSVVVRRLIDGQPQSGELYLLVKGADNVIFERLASGQDELKQKTDDQLEQFATEGLRTLCLAYRKLDPDQLEAWSQRYSHACSQLGPDRQELISSAEDELESNLILLGATAIEDKLQDGVPQAIADLKRAGIKVWVATGDKLETAVAIARSCHLIGQDVNLIVIRGGAYGERASAYDQIRQSLINFFDGLDLVDELKELPPDHSVRLLRQSASRPSLPNSVHDDLASIVGEDNGQRPGGYGLVIDGGSLNHALEEPFTREALLELATRCSSVVCCRTSPKQKSEIVRLIKEGIGAQTLAIGDGANDVSMIQTADIGVGVSGEEGMQAVNSSDYAISQFRFICKLLFVHGHWSYDRNSKMILNFFYKEIIGIIALWLYQFWCAYSSTILYEYTYLLFYNVFWTLIPVIAIGVFDQDISQKVLMQVPELYSNGRDGNLFGLRRFAFYMLQGIYQGSICFFFITFSYNSTSARADGLDVAFTEFSTVVIVAIILACNLFHGLDQSIWNWWMFAGVLFGPLIILLYTAAYSAIKPGWIWTAVYGNNTFLWPAAYWWFGILFTVISSLLPHYLWRYYQEMYYPTDLQVLRHVDKRDSEHDFLADDQMPFKRENEKYMDEAKEHTPALERMKSEAGSVPLGPEIMRSRTSLMHDMATGQLSPNNRGFNFDQADGVGGYAVGNRLRRYNTSLLSLGAGGTGTVAEDVQRVTQGQARQSANGGKDRSKSMRLGNLQFAFGGHHRRQGTTMTTGSAATGHASLAQRISTFLHPNHALHHHHHSQDQSSSADPDLNNAPTVSHPPAAENALNPRATLNDAQENS